MYLLLYQWWNGQHIQLPLQRPQELNGIEWQGTMLNDLHMTCCIFSWPGAELDRFPEKVMGHAMIWSKTQAWINNFTDKYSDSINFKKLGPLWVKNIPTSWQNVVPPRERESVEILGFRVFVFSQQSIRCVYEMPFFWDVSCSSTFWLLKRDACFLISRHHMLCSSKCG